MNEYEQLALLEHLWGITGNRKESNFSQVLKAAQTWPVWLRGLSISLQTERLLVQFLVRAHAWVVGQVP